MVKMVLTVSSQLTDSESYILYYLYVAVRDRKEADECVLTRRISQNGR